MYRATLACLLLLIACPAFGELYDGVVVFGDSFSDTGNASAITGGLIPPSPPYAEGRMSDGELWIEILARELGFDIVAVETDSDGNNYATAASLISDDDDVIPGITLESLATQVDSYLDSVDDEASPETLYVLFGGHNDVRDAADPENELAAEEQESIILDAVDGLIDSATQLLDAGAEFLLIPSAANIGVTPEASIRDVVELSTDLTELFNEELAEQLETVRDDYDAATIYTIDPGPLLDDVIADATENGGEIYGITNVTEPAFEGLAGSPGHDPAESAFVDTLHVTHVIHELFAWLVLPVVAPPVEFVRGDIDADGEIDLADGIAVLEDLFLGGIRSLCRDAADFDDDDRLHLSDAILLLTHVFLDGDPPAPPTDECDPDPTDEDRMTCLEHEYCS